MHKYIVIHLVKHTDSFYAQTPSEEIDTQQEVNEFFREWYPRVTQLHGVHALGMIADWDWMGVFGVDELSDWEACREDYKRRFFGRTEKALSLPGVSHEEFVRATSSMAHYKTLRAAGVFPGGAEKFAETVAEA